MYSVYYLNENDEVGFGKKKIGRGKEKEGSFGKEKKRGCKEKEENVCKRKKEKCGGSEEKEEGCSVSISYLGYAT